MTRLYYVASAKLNLLSQVEDYLTVLDNENETELDELGKILVDRTT